MRRLQVRVLLSQLVKQIKGVIQMRIEVDYESMSKEDLVRLAKDMRESYDELSAIVKNQRQEYIDYIEHSAIKNIV